MEERWGWCCLYWRKRCLQVPGYGERTGTSTYKSHAWILPDISRYRSWVPTNLPTHNSNPPSAQLHRSIYIHDNKHFESDLNISPMAVPFQPANNAARLTADSARCVRNVVRYSHLKSLVGTFNFLRLNGLISRFNCSCSFTASLLFYVLRSSWSYWRSYLRLRRMAVPELALGRRIPK